MKRITIADVAKHANVSKSTVSQYLNKRYEYMSQETKKNIEAAIMQLNYRPNLMARSLKQKSSFTIGIIVANIVHNFSTKVINSLEEIFSKEGFQLMVCNSADNPLTEKKHVLTLLEKQVDGLIIFPTGENTDLYMKLEEENTPIVFIDRFIESVNIPAVLLDNYYAIDQAVSIFNMHPLAIITTSLKVPITPRVERLEGFRKALTKRGIPIDEQYIRNSDPENIAGVFKDLMNLEKKPKGIIAANDRVLQELMLFLKKHPEINVPHDLQIVVIDEVPYAPFSSPSLTTLEQPVSKITTKASELLLNKIKNPNTSTEKKLYRYTPTLIERESTL